MKRFVTLLMALVLLSGASAASAKLRVVATTADLASVAREIGGKHVEVGALSLPTQNTHWVDPRPHLALELARADLLLITGADIEVGWLPTLLTGSRNAKIQKGGEGYLDCSTLVRLMDVPTGKLDRAQGDLHPLGNPHYMYDPRRVERVAVGIGKRLASLDGAHKAAYLAGTKAFLAKLRAARRGWEKTLSALRGEEVIAYHKSLVYLADWLGLKVLDHVEPRPGIPPNPRHVAHVLAEARAHQVRILLQEDWFPDTTAALVAKKCGARLVTFPGMPSFAAGQGYVEHMDGIVRSLARAAGQ